METREWNLLNAAQRVIPKLSEAQKRAVIHARGDGRIVATGDVAEWSAYAAAPTITVLRELGIGEGGSRRNTYLTSLGQMLREVLIGRASETQMPTATPQRD